MPRALSRSRTKAKTRTPNATPALNALLAAGRSAAAHSPRKSRIAGSGLEAPITGEIERQLEQLIK